MKKTACYTSRRFRLVFLSILVFLFAVLAASQGMADTVTKQKALSLDDLFPNDRVLDVQITLTKENWDELRNQSQSFYDVLNEGRRLEAPPSRYTYVPASVTIDGVEFPKIGLRKKGFIG